MKRFKNFKFLIIFLIVSLLTYALYKYNSSLISSSQTVIRNQQVKEQIVVYKKEDVDNLIKSHLMQQQKTNIKLTTKKQLKYSYLSKYPDMLNCNPHMDTLKKWSPSELSTFTKEDYTKAAANITYDQRFLRAVLVYFPIEKSNEFSNEFKWLYRSWIEMIKSEPVKWRTDLIVFIEKDDKYFDDPKYFFNELNCSFVKKRQNANDKPMCILIQYTPIAKRNLQQLTDPIFHNENDNAKKLKFHFLLDKVNIFSTKPEDLLPFYVLLKENLNSYGYTDSILMAFDGYEYFKTAGYDYLIRSDMDVFLTPLLAKWLPKNCNDFIVGGGAYSENFNRKRLKRIALDLMLEHVGADNLGSTWISSPDQFRIVSYLTLFSMIYISKEEFSLPEKQGKVSLWPYWHYGVLLLYGQNIGMNHLIASKQINIVKLNDYIDFPSGNTEDINHKLHIHVYHGGEMFSKFDFKAGKYDNMTLPADNLNQVKVYCLKMALESKRTSEHDLYKLLESESDKKL